jgi:hypothetical protein
MRPILIGASLLACALVACNKEDKPAAAEPPALPAAAPAAPAATTAAVATAAAAPAAAASVAANTPAAGELPTAPDFEQAALDEINPQNIESELDKLEKEIAQ